MAVRSSCGLFNIVRDFLLTTKQKRWSIKKYACCNSGNNRGNCQIEWKKTQSTKNAPFTGLNDGKQRDYL